MLTHTVIRTMWGSYHFTPFYSWGNQSPERLNDLFRVTQPVSGIVKFEPSVSHAVMSDSLWPHGLYSLPDTSVHGILQARILEWVAVPFFRGSSWPRDWTESPALQADSLPSETQGFFRKNAFSGVRWVLKYSSVILGKHKIILPYFQVCVNFS